MKINWIEFENKNTGLVIERASFYPELTLLIGLSGAGKTQILNAIKTMCSFGYKSMREVPFKGKMNFTIDNNVYEWEMDTTTDETFDNNVLNTFTEISQLLLEFDSNEETIKFESEKLFCNGKQVFTRTGSNLEFGEYKNLPTINPNNSVIHQFSNDDLISDVYNHLKRIYQMSSRNLFSNSVSSNTLSSIEPIIKQLKLLSNDIGEYRKIFPHNYPLALKLHILKTTNDKLFNQFLNLYKSIFEEITDFSIKKYNSRSSYYEIYFHTQHSTLSYDEISSGMQKTFSCIFDLLTISDDYAVLIDEIENSLGANCLSHVYKDLLSLRHDLQFIITSHHPYIISNVSPSQCKFVHRKEHLIRTYTADDLGVSNEYFDFFDVVINKLKYGELP